MNDIFEDLTRADLIRLVSDIRRILKEEYYSPREAITDIIKSLDYYNLAQGMKKTKTVWTIN